MDGRRDFTIDPVNFRDLPQLVDEVKKDGLRFIAIIVSAITTFIYLCETVKLSYCTHNVHY